MEMDINNLTIGQAKEIAATFGASAPAKSNARVGSELIGKKVIVRASSAGVHYGTLKAIDGETVTLENARRLWFWRVSGKKGISLSDVADHGLADDSKVCTVVPTHIVIGACEVMLCNSTAITSIEGADVYQP